MRLQSGIAVLCVVVMGLLPGSARAQEAPRPESGAVWKDMVERLEPAAFITLRLTDGRQFKGTVVSAGEDRFVFQPRTRIPVDPVTVPYGDVMRIERARQGMNPGSKVLVGTGSVIGGLLVLFAIALANAD